MDELEPQKKAPPWAEGLVRLLDDGLKLPFLKKGIGLDAIIGLFLPVAGDTLTGVGSVALLGAALKQGVPTIILLRMVLNIGVDVLLGAIPILGDLFDIMWRSNRYNLSLIEKHAGKKEKASAMDYLVVLLGFGAAIAAVLVPIIVLAYFGTWIATEVKSLF